MISLFHESIHERGISSFIHVQIVINSPSIWQYNDFYILVGYLFLRLLLERYTIQDRMKLEKWETREIRCKIRIWFPSVRIHNRWSLETLLIFREYTLLLIQSHTSITLLHSLRTSAWVFFTFFHFRYALYDLLI